MGTQTGGPLLVLGWEPDIRPYVIDAVGSCPNGVVAAVEAEITSPPPELRGQCVIPLLYALPSRHVAELVACGQAAGVSGVLTFEDELALLSAQVAARLGLPGPSPAAVQTAMSKSACRTALAAAGVPSTPFAVISARDTVKSALNAAEVAWPPLPVVVKPDALCGSKGVFLVQDHASVATAVRHSQELAESGPLGQNLVVVEGYLEGRNVTAELALADGRQQVLAVVDTDYRLQRLAFGEKFALKGLNFPSTLPAAVQEEAGQVALAAARACGLGNTLVHVEMRCSATGVKVIEVNPRGAGAFLPEVVQMCAGTRYVGAAFAIASGADLPRPGPSACPAAAVRFLPIPRGWPAAGSVRVHAVEWDKVPEASVHRASVRVRPGGKISAGVSSLGYVIVTGSDPREACAVADRMVDGFRVVFARDGS